jgi:hypothetical protein
MTMTWAPAGGGLGAGDAVARHPHRKVLGQHQRLVADVGGGVARRVDPDRALQLAAIAARQAVGRDAALGQGQQQLADDRRLARPAHGEIADADHRRADDARRGAGDAAAGGVGPDPRQRGQQGAGQRAGRAGLAYHQRGVPSFMGPPRPAGPRMRSRPARASASRMSTKAGRGRRESPWRRSGPARGGDRVAQHRASASPRRRPRQVGEGRGPVLDERGPLIAGQSSRAASSGLWPPIPGTRLPAMTARSARRNHRPISPRVSATITSARRPAPGCAGGGEAPGLGQATIAGPRSAWRGPAPPGAIGQGGESVQHDLVLARMGAGDQQHGRSKPRAQAGQGGLVDRQRRGAELQVGLAGDLAAQGSSARRRGRPGPGSGRSRTAAGGPRRPGACQLGEAAVRQLGRDQGQLPAALASSSRLGHSSLSTKTARLRLPAGDEPPGAARGVDRQVLVDRARRQALGQQGGRGDGAGGDQHRDFRGARPAGARPAAGSTGSRRRWRRAARPAGRRGAPWGRARRSCRRAGSSLPLRARLASSEGASGLEKARGGR